MGTTGERVEEVGAGAEPREQPVEEVEEGRHHERAESGSEEEAE